MLKSLESLRAKPILIAVLAAFIGLAGALLSAGCLPKKQAASALKESSYAGSFATSSNRPTRVSVPAKESTGTPAPASLSLFSAPAETSGSAISLVAVGDVCINNPHVAHTQKYALPYLNIRNILRSGDLAFGNLECALSSRGAAIPGKEFTFRGAPGVSRLLRDAGFDVFSVANNHSKDFGELAFLDTLTALKEAGVGASGGGRNEAEAFRPVVLNVKDKKVAFLSFSGVLPPGFWATSRSCGVASLRDGRKVLAAVKAARAQADIVVVSVHWGQELSIMPSKAQVTLGRQIIDAGAAVVLGHHPHVVQGFERYKGGLIAYSLGNFIFSPGNAKGRQSVILSTKISRNQVVEATVFPVYIEGIRPKLLSEAPGRAWLAEVSRRSAYLKTPQEGASLR